MAGDAVQVEDCGILVCSSVVGIEANTGEGSAGCDGAIPAGGGDRDGLTGLSVVAVPGLIELLVAGVGPGNGPGCDGGAAGVADGQASREAGAPVVLINVGDVAGPGSSGGLGGRAGLVGGS